MLAILPSRGVVSVSKETKYNVIKYSSMFFILDQKGMNVKLLGRMFLDHYQEYQPLFPFGSFSFFLIIMYTNITRIRPAIKAGWLSLSMPYATEETPSIPRRIRINLNLSGFISFGLASGMIFLKHLPNFAVRLCDLHRR